MAAARTWDEIGSGLQAVVTSLLRLSGLGFLLVGLQLGVVAIVGTLRRDIVVTLALPLLSLLFCAGLCAVNLQLHRRTAAETPWQGSLYAAIAGRAGPRPVSPALAGEQNVRPNNHIEPVGGQVRVPVTL